MFINVQYLSAIITSMKTHCFTCALLYCHSQSVYTPAFSYGHRRSYSCWQIHQETLLSAFSLLNDLFKCQDVLNKGQIGGFKVKWNLFIFFFSTIKFPKNLLKVSNKQDVWFGHMKSLACLYSQVSTLTNFPLLSCWFECNRITFIMPYMFAFCHSNPKPLSFVVV